MKSVRGQYFELIEFASDLSSLHPPGTPQRNAGEWRVGYFAQVTAPGEISNPKILFAALPQSLLILRNVMEFKKDNNLDVTLAKKYNSLHLTLHSSLKFRQHV